MAQQVTNESGRGVRAISQFAPMYFRKFLTCDETLEFTQLGKQLSPSPCTVEQDYYEARRSLGADVDPKSLPVGLQSRIDEIAQVANSTFGFDLLCAPPDLCFLRYGRDDFFEWHHDVGEQTENIRKVSFSIQLSDPFDYDGGDLAFAAMKSPSIAKELGTLVIFPAFNMHCVQPVTRGVRFSLVGWFYGPKFR